jgi:protein TonB
MTVSYPLDAFETAQPPGLRRASRLDRDKLIGIGITGAVHAVILAMALTAVHVSRSKVMQELSVQITPEKTQKIEELKPAPKLMTAPTLITAPPPEFVVRTIAPPPVAAQPPVTAPVKAAAPAPQQSTGEGRDSFQASVLAHINRFKQYPREARKAHIEGVTQVHFIMDREGKLLSSEIYKSSGRPALDREALATVQRAQPLPAIPNSFPTPTLDAIVSVEFTLR